jgi:hypothetical protein
MNGLMIGYEGLLIKLTKEKTTLLFDHRLNTKGGFVSGIKMVPILNLVAKAIVETNEMTNNI